MLYHNNVVVMKGNEVTILNIVPVAKAGAYRTGKIQGLTLGDIQDKLGFAPNVADAAGKVTASWGFVLNPTAEGKGAVCGIWDYKGSGRLKQWSTYGPREVFQAIFGDAYVGE